VKAIPQNSNTPSRGKKRRRRRMANRGAPVESSASPASLNTAQPDKKRKFSQSKRSRRQGPSEEALALSTKLKEYSSQKRLSEALELFWHPSSDSIRDGHHACIVIDCSARCGSIKVRALETRRCSRSILNTNHLRFLRTEKRSWMK
jgi:hypothetical protein